MHHPQSLVENTVPALIFGTGNRQSGKPSGVSVALTTGYTAIDSACNDPYDEEATGRNIKYFLRDQCNVDDYENHVFHRHVLVQSKYSSWQFFNQKPAPYDRKDSIPLQVLKSLQTSLKQLQLSSVDVYMIHRPFADIANTFAAWEVMEEIVRRKGARYIGISQVDLKTLSILYEKSDVKPAVVQNYFSAKNNFDEEVRSFCKAKGIWYQAFGVLGPDNHRLIQSEAVNTLSISNGLSREAAFLVMVLACTRLLGEKFTILTGSTAIEHMKENLGAAIIANSISRQEAERLGILKRQLYHHLNTQRSSHRKHLTEAARHKSILTG